MCSLGGRDVRGGEGGGGGGGKGGGGAGEGKGERAERGWGGGVRKWSERGRQEVRSQVRGGDNDKLCFSVASDREGERWRAGREGQRGEVR